MPTYTKYYYTKPPEQKPGTTYTKYGYTKKPQTQPVVEQKKPIYTQPKPSYQKPSYQPPQYQPPKQTYVKPIQNDNKYKPKPQPKPKPKPICKPECDIEVIGQSSGEAPFTARFSASQSSDRDGQVTEFLWDFGDGRTGSGENVSHRYIDPGNYTVTLRVKDNDGYYSDNTCKTKITVTEKENEEPECIIARASPQRGDAPLRVDFEGDGRDDTTDENDLRYFWDFDDGETSSLRNPTHTFDDDNREFRVTLEVEDEDGKRSSNRCEVTIRTNEEEEDLVCEFDLDKDVKDDKVKVKVDARDSEGDIDKYKWDFDDDNDDDEEEGVEADHTYDEDDEGSHTIRLTITGENGDEEKCSRRIDIDIEEEETKIVKIVKKVEAKEEGEVKGVSAPKTGSQGLMIGLTLFMIGLMLKSLLIKVEAAKKYNY